MPLIALLIMTFLLVGIVSFGGGYAMLPVIDRMVVSQVHWFRETEFIDMIAVASMAPGPIATNAAVMVGYRLLGFPGALVAAVSVAMPSLVLILLFARAFFKYRRHRLVASAFDVLRPVIAGMIFYAAASFAQRNGLLSLHVSWSTLLLFLIAFVLFARTKVHPALILLASGLAGLVIHFPR
ncbi:MAG: chromate transporter [Hydrogenibacillus sp.]|nr:chromate transporter [Hydrogenibacillus sp.]